jgi:hypothetical protein
VKALVSSTLALAVGCSGSSTPPDRDGIMVNNAGLDGSVGDDAAPDGAIASLVSNTVLLSFGTVLTSTESAGQSATISNQGDASVIASLVTSGAGATAYVIDSETCVGTTLAGPSTCSAQVRFAPTVAGASDATLTVNGSGSGLVTIVLKGTGVPPGALAFTPTSGAFNNVTAGMSGDVTLGLQNTSTAPSGAITVQISGPDLDQFQVTANNCAGGLAASGTCSLTVRFSPTATGARNATLSASDALGATMTAALTGTGI